LNSLSQALARHVEPGVDDQRRLERAKAVLPVRILGNDVSGASYSELVHTLDVSKAGVRLGAVRRQLEVGSPITIQYRQHRAEFRVIWIRPVGTGAEHQIGLEADAQRDLWGLDADPRDRSRAAAPAPSNHASIGA
jgi:PilZ domain-containing protein